jgi:uncharacterized YccA/Bax inhibitor family protein
MSNPLLNEEALKKAANAPGWGAPDPASRSTPLGGPVGGPLGAGPMADGMLTGTPYTDGPVSAWHGRVMTVGGTATATGVLLVLLLISATAGWIATETSDNGAVAFPATAMIGVLVGFVCVIALMFKPMWAKFLAPVYALAQGFFVGAISKAYESWQNGIVVQAIGATVGVFLVMLVLYRTRIIKVTNTFRKVVIGATLGLAVFYLVAMVFSLFGNTPGFLTEPSLLGIGFSIFAAGLAAFNLALDFDFIEQGAAAKMPKGMEWYAAFGLLVTIVWLYLELLRLLSKLNQR